MVGSNAQDRTAKPPKKSKDSKLALGGGSLGVIQLSSSEHGINAIGASGENSGESDISLSGRESNQAISGKIVSQLIEETQKQLAYHQLQTEVLQDRLSELKAIEIKE